MATETRCPESTDGRHYFDAPCDNTEHGHERGASVCVCGLVAPKQPDLSLLTDQERADLSRPSRVPRSYSVGAERGSMIERTERAIRDADERTGEALGEALVAAFPEAVTGDESPDVVFGRLAAIRASVIEWVNVNVIGDADWSLDDCPTHGLSVSTDDAPHAHP